MNSGIQCERLGHMRCVPGADRNPFGLDFKAAGLRWTKALCQKDSDGDGLTNGEELGDPCCLWSAANPTELRLTMLSHPGERDMDGAKSAPKCKKGGGTKPGAEVPNVCGNMKRSVEVACVCFVTFRKMIKVPMRKNVLKMCGQRFGGKAKINKLRSACDGFRDKSGKLNEKKILKSVRLLKSCPLS